MFNGGFKGMILLDEVSNEVLPVLAALDITRLSGMRIITFGDWNRLPPIANSWRGDAVDDDVFMQSRLYKHWSDSTMFVLTQPRRCDPQHFQFNTQLPEDLGEAVRLARQRCPPNLNADWNLVMSNARRKSISITRQLRLAAGRETIQVPEGEDPAYPLFVGTKLIGCLTIKKCVNGAFYEVVSIGKLCQVRDELTREVWEATPEHLSQCVHGSLLFVN